MKKILLFTVISLLSVSLFSQEKLIKPAKFSDNWFIQLQGGGSYTLSEYYKDASFGDLISPHVAVSVGKYFAPVAGIRAQVGGWQSRNHYAGEDGSYNFKVKYLQYNADGLFNLTNAFLPYDKDRAFNFIAIAGLGYVHGFKDSEVGLSSTHSIVPRAGFQLDFRVSDAVSLNLEAVGNLMNDDFNGRKQGTKYDGTINVLGGVTFKLGKSGWDVADYIDPMEVSALNDQINAQRAQIGDKDRLLADKNRQIEGYKLQLAQKPTVVEKAVELEETVMNAVVVFKLGKSELQDKNQEINIYNAAKFFQENPNLDIIVTGYADKATGTAAINQKLSERRAETVAKILIEQYGISPTRITKQASGDREQPFAKDEWNRVVIFTAVPKTLK